MTGVSVATLLLSVFFMGYRFERGEWVWFAFAAFTAAISLVTLYRDRRTIAA